MVWVAGTATKTHTHTLSPHSHIQQPQDSGHRLPQIFNNAHTHTHTEDIILCNTEWAGNGLGEETLWHSHAPWWWELITVDP